MIKEELEKEARTECFMLTVNTIGIDQRDVELAYIMGAEPREKRIEELEKENAEMKKQLEMSNKVYNDNLDYCHHIEALLTKAKEIIKKLVNGVRVINDPKVELTDCDGFLAEAEQFLKECEK